MTPVDDLFQLIKSLTRTEKRYFKIFSSQHIIRKESNCIKLFDAIEKQDSYNEEQIKQMLKREIFIKHLSSQKVYLYNLILKSLELYHNNIESDLRSSVNQIKILYDKGLYKQCEKRIAKAKYIAEKYEKFPVLFDLLRWEGQIAYLHTYGDKSVEDVEAIYAKLRQYQGTYNMIISYVSLNASIQMVRKKMGSLRTGEEKIKYDSIIKNGFIKDERNFKSFEALVFYYQAKFSDSFFRKRMKHAPVFLSKMLSLMQQHPHRVEDYPRFYASTLLNLSVVKRDQKQYGEILPLLNKLKELNIKDKDLKEEFTNHAEHMEMILYIETGDFEKGLKIVKHMEKEKFHSETFKSSREHEINFYYNAAIICFGVGDYAACNKFLNKIILNESWELRNDLHGFARIIALISNYERKRNDLIAYSFKNTYKFLLKRSRLYKLEEIILEYIRTKLQKAETRKQQIEVFKSLKSEIELLENDSNEQAALAYFYFIPWLDSKIENRPFAEMVRRKVEAGK